MITLYDIAKSRGAELMESGAIREAEFARVMDLLYWNHCQRCRVELYPQEAYPGRNGLFYCSPCAEPELTYASIEEFDSDPDAPGVLTAEAVAKAGRPAGAPLDALLFVEAARNHASKYGLNPRDYATLAGILAAWCHLLSLKGGSADLVVAAVRRRLSESQ